MKKQKMFFCWLCCPVLLFVCIGATSTFASKSNATAVKALIEKKCSTCHSTERVYKADKTHDKWKQTVKKMARYSDQMNFLNQKERKTLIDFLVKRKSKQ